MKKVIIIGCPGSGKSTFARALQTATGLPLYYLDMLYWNADRSIVPREVFRARLAEILAREEWIIDGNYGSTMEWRMQACDTVIFLDYPAELCLAGIRERQGKPRPDMPWVETEDDAEFMDYIRSFQETSRPKILQLLAQYAHREIFQFRSREEAEAWMDKLSR